MTRVARYRYATDAPSLFGGSTTAFLVDVHFRSPLYLREGVTWRLAAAGPSVPRHEKDFSEGCCPGSGSAPRRGAAVLRNATRMEHTPFARPKQG
jgi:hypothetical protein